MAEDFEDRRFSIDRLGSDTDAPGSQITREDTAFSSLHTGTRVEPELQLQNPADEDGASAVPTVMVEPVELSAPGRMVGMSSDTGVGDALPGIPQGDASQVTNVVLEDETATPTQVVEVPAPTDVDIAGAADALAPSFSVPAPGPVGAPATVQAGNPGAGSTLDEPSQEEGEPVPADDVPSDQPTDELEPDAGAPVLVADAPALATRDAAGNEDTAIALDIAALAVDPSETLDVTVTGLPEGARLSAGTPDGNGGWSLAPADLPSLTLTPPANFSGRIDLAVTATATDGADTAATAATLAVDVAPVADAPLLTTTDLAGVEDMPIPFDITGPAALESEVVVVFSGGTAGYHNSSGVYTIGQDGTIKDVRIAFADMKQVVDGTRFEFKVIGPEAPTIGTFVVANGAHVNDAYPGMTLDADHLAFVFRHGTSEERRAKITDSAEDVTLVHTDQAGERPIEGDIFHAMPGLNPDGLNHVALSRDGDQIRHGYEDLFGLGDRDFDDVILDIDVATTELVPPTNLGSAISLASRDIDGSEGLSIQITGLPEGAALSAGSAGVDGTWSLTPGDLVGLTLIPPKDFAGRIDLAVTATATDGADTAATAATLAVDVAPVADAPALATRDAAGNEDTAIALDIAALAVDPSETLDVTVTGLPEGARLSAGTPDGNGGWSLAPADLPGLTLTPPADFSGRIDLAVTATATDGADTAATAATLAVDVAPVADAPWLSVAIERVSEGPGEIEIGSTPNPWATPDAHQLFSDGLTRNQNVRSGNGDDVIVIEGHLSGGNNIHLFKGNDLLEIQGSFGRNVHVNGGQGADAMILPKALDTYSIHNFVEHNGSFHLQLTDPETGGNLVVNHVEAIGFGDGRVIGDERLLPVSDAVYDLRIEALSGDIDRSETLSVSLSGMPDGAVLSAGDQDADGTWALSLSDLADLQLRMSGKEPDDFLLRVTATSRETNAFDEVASEVLDVMVIDGAGKAESDTRPDENPPEAMPKLTLEDIAIAQAAPVSDGRDTGTPHHGFVDLTLDDLAELVIASSSVPVQEPMTIDLLDIDTGAFSSIGNIADTASLIEANV